MAPLQQEETVTLHFHIPLCSDLRMKGVARCILAYTFEYSQVHKIVWQDVLTAVTL